MELTDELKESIKDMNNRIDRFKVKFNSKEEAYDLIFWLSFYKSIPVDHEAGKWDFLSNKNDSYWIYLNTPIGLFIQHYHVSLVKGQLLGVPNEITENEFRIKIECLVEKYGELTYKSMYEDIDMKR